MGIWDLVVLGNELNIALSVLTVCFVHRLAQANKDMAELNSRLVNAAFGNAFSGALPESVRASLSDLENIESSSHLDRQSSNPASEDLSSIAGLPPGVPLDPFYD